MGAIAAQRGIGLSNERECPMTYLYGSVAGLFSILLQASYPDKVVFHFIVDHRRAADLSRVVTATFPYPDFHLYHFDPNLIRGKISYSICQALQQPLNYARIYFPYLIPSGVRRII